MGTEHRPPDSESSALLLTPALTWERQQDPLGPDPKEPVLGEEAGKDWKGSEPQVWPASALSSLGSGVLTGQRSG